MEKTVKYLNWVKSQRQTELTQIWSQVEHWHLKGITSETRFINYCDMITAAELTVNSVRLDDWIIYHVLLDFDVTTQAFLRVGILERSESKIQQQHCIYSILNSRENSPAMICFIITHPTMEPKEMVFKSRPQRVTCNSSRKERRLRFHLGHGWRYPGRYLRCKKQWTTSVELQPPSQAIWKQLRRGSTPTAGTVHGTNSWGESSNSCRRNRCHIQDHRMGSLQTVGCLNALDGPSTRLSRAWVGRQEWRSQTRRRCQSE